jgi:hypothetical protein
MALTTGRFADRVATGSISGHAARAADENEPAVPSEGWRDGASGDGPMGADARRLPEARLGRAAGHGRSSTAKAHAGLS